MDIQQLRYFIAVAKYETVSRAARELYMSQPNLSTAIRRLEEGLGFPLFNRRRGKVSLTPGGRVFLDSAERAVRELEEGAAAAKGIYEAERRRIRLAAPMPDLTADVLGGITAKYPGISIRQFNFTNSECLDALEKGQADIAIVFGPITRKEIEFVPLDGCEWVVMAGRDSPFYGRGWISASELNGVRCVSNISRDDGRFLRTLEEKYAVRAEVVCECDNDLVEMNLLMAGVGISLTPLMNYIKLADRSPEFDAGLVRIRDQLPPVELGYAYRRGYELTPEAEELCGALREIFAAGPEHAREFLKSRGYCDPVT